MPLHYLQKNGDEVDYLPADKHEMFLQVDSITLGVLSTQNNKFAISLQYIKERVMDEVDFFPADNTSILGVCDQACPNYSK